MTHRAIDPAAIALTPDEMRSAIVIAKRKRLLTAYLSTLLVLGLAMTTFGTLLPLGGGLAIAGIGSASTGAGLVLIGIRMTMSKR